MVRLAPHALLLLAVSLAACASDPAAVDDAMSAAQLHALVFGDQQPASLDDLAGRKVSVQGDVDLRYGGQKRLLVDDEDGDCVQLIVPSAIDRHFAAQRFRARIEGTLLVFPTPADGEIYVHYKVDGIPVYPACDGRTMVFLKVEKLTKS